MIYPTLPVQQSTREMTDVFAGYNRELRIGPGEAYDMRNMTSDHYPVMAPRGRRGIYRAAASPQGIIAKDQLCYVDGENLVIGDTVVKAGLSIAEADCPKQLISMGAYVIIMPDKQYVNTRNPEDRGSIEASFVSEGTVTFSLCALTGDGYSDATVSDTAPENPENLDYWLDTSGAAHVLKRYSSVSGWVSVPATYVKISAPGLGKGFQVYDGVSISGITVKELLGFNGSAIVQATGEDYVIVPGMLDQVTEQLLSQGAITIERRMPNMDFIIESGNRLWGCRYGEARNGEQVNEIYASKLGDFKNWSCYMSLSTDSYTASCGTDGPFTGAVTHMGYPMFFKENCVHMVYGNYPANYQIQTTACRGVQKGCHGSLAIVNETLYYKARSGVCAYDGAAPVEVSAALGNERYYDAVAGAHGNKYYISMRDSTGGWHLLVYDTARGLWHREDDLQVSAFCSWHGEMYAIDRDRLNILTLLGSGTQETGPVEWMWQTGELGLSTQDRKYLSGLLVRLWLDRGATAEIYVQYDRDDSWEKVCHIRGTALSSFNVPVRPRRCDFLRLRIEGRGDGRVYAITQIITGGSDRT